MWYSLIDKKAVPVATGEESNWLCLSIEERRVAFTELQNGFRVSTVFVGLDHGLAAHGPPLVFETIVFHADSMLDEDCKRYSTWKDAEAGHAAMVEKWKAMTC